MGTDQGALCPTVEEAGQLKGYELIAWFALLAPARTPTEIVTRLNEAVQRAAQDPVVRRKLSEGLGVSVRASTPQELAAKIPVEAAKWGKAVAEAGIEKQ
ncbi:MAG: hypothetical protein IOC52_00875 [Methylobacterium sp.]|nr:hypothetical protein [Methylobacterium sp.]